ncbi:MAG: hypothetical protein ABR571_04800 [Jatrophihabitans sp.]|uniref:hypothetical protein n=1 Tax=Jatrophihabitans sp. TaxID=1932789 RepID=UPI003911CE3E
MTAAAALRRSGRHTDGRQRVMAAGFLNRYAEAAGDMEHGARLAERAGDTASWNRAMSNLASILVTIDASAAAAASRSAIDGARQLGNRFQLAVAIPNLAMALMFSGDWVEAERVLAEAIEADGFDDDSLISGYVAMAAAALACLRGDRAAIDATHSAFTDMRASEDPQDLAAAAFVDALQAAGRGRQEDVLRHVRSILGYASALGIASEYPNWAWPLGVRAAFELGDDAAVEELLVLLDGYPSGHIPPLLRAERALARARQRVAARQSDADTALEAAVAELRAVASPYHLAHALLDQAEYLAGAGRSGEAEISVPA